MLIAAFLLGATAVSPVVAMPSQEEEEVAIGRGPGVPEQEMADLFDDARGLLLTGLVTHAEWCNAAKLYLERNKAYERVLELDPEHSAARKALGYRKRKGEWQRDPKTRTAKNYKPAKLKEAGRKLAEAVRPYTDELRGFIDARGEQLSFTQLERVASEILAVEPDAEDVNRLLGRTRIEVSDEATGTKSHAWVLAETATAKERRRSLAKLVRDLFRKAPKPERAKASDKDTKIGLSWTAILATDRFRAVGTVDRQEATKVLSALHVCEGYFNGAFGTKVHLEPGMTVYLLANPAERFSLVDEHPDVPSGRHDFVKSLDGTGTGGAQDIFHWAKTDQRRADGVVRIALGNLFTRAFKITTRNSWVYEGFGLYMTYAVVRSRLNWFANPSQYLMGAEEKELRSRMIHPDTLWMQEAYTILLREEPPSVLDVLSVPLSEFATHDLLFSYVLAAFLLEAHPEETPEILTEIGKGKRSIQALCEGLGMEPPAIEARILQWLSERR